MLMMVLGQYRVVRNELLNVEQGIFGVLETDMSKRDIDISNISAVNLTLEPSGRPITVRYLHFSMPLLLHPKISQHRIPQIIIFAYFSLFNVE